MKLSSVRHWIEKSKRYLATIFILLALYTLLVVVFVAAILPAAAPSRTSTSSGGTLPVETVEVVVEGETVIVTATPGGMIAAAGSSTNLPVSYSPVQQMIIKDAQMELLVKSSHAAVEQVTQLAASQGGYIIDSRTWYEGEYLHATMRMAVPVATFETTLNTMRTLGIKVLNETATGQDVSANYADMQTRLKNLEATAVRVRQLLDDAKKVEESLQISNTLSELEGQIEQIKGQMKFYEGRAAFSTITVTLTPEILPVTPTPTPSVPWDPGETYRSASNALVDKSQGVVDGLIWVVIVYGPFALAAALVLWVVSAGLRHFSKPRVRPLPAEKQG